MLSFPHTFLLSLLSLTRPQNSTHTVAKMVMPISFLDLLDSRREFKGYKEPKSQSSSGTQTPKSKEAEAAETNEARSGVMGTDGSTPRGLAR